MENPEPANIHEIVQQNWLPKGIVIDIFKENLVKKVDNIYRIYFDKIMEFKVTICCSQII
jgi:hypothetical protein